MVAGFQPAYRFAGAGLGRRFRRAESPRLSRKNESIRQNGFERFVQGLALRRRGVTIGLGVLLGVMLGPVWALDPAKSLDEYHYEAWEAAEGLPHYSINSIVLGSEGYLWLATFRKNAWIRAPGDGLADASIRGLHRALQSQET